MLLWLTFMAWQRDYPAVETVSSSPVESAADELPGAADLPALPETSAVPAAPDVVEPSVPTRRDNIRIVTDVLELELEHSVGIAMDQRRVERSDEAITVIRTCCPPVPRQNLPRREPPIEPGQENLVDQRIQCRLVRGQLLATAVQLLREDLYRLLDEVVGARSPHDRGQ